MLARVLVTASLAFAQFGRRVHKVRRTIGLHLFYAARWLCSFMVIACVAPALTHGADASTSAVLINPSPPAVATESAATNPTCTPLTPYTGQPLEKFEPTTALEQTATIKVGAVRVVRLPVFDLSDPEQDLWPYRLAMRFRNTFGLNTRDWVISNDLLFRPGDVVSLRTLAESERLLRQRGYVYDARVLPAQRCGDSVDVDVVTRDVWTLSPRLDVSRSGGSSNLGIGLSDVNFLGTGKYVSGGYRKTVDREGLDIRFYDPNVLGTHDTFGIGVAKTKEGYYRAVNVERPFFALDSRFSWGASVVRSKNNDKLYFHGDDFAEFRHVTEFETVFAGWSPGLVDGKQQRWRVGYSHADDHFEVDARRVVPPKLAPDRAIAYPFISFESIEEDFHVTKNLNRIQQHEDLYLGRRYGVRVGYSTQSNNRYIFHGDYADGFRFGAEGRTLVLYDVAVNGAWRKDIDKSENVEVVANVRWRDQQSRRFAAFAALGVAWTDQMTFDKQLLLGGDTGLRGYPLRYQVGDRRFLLSLEERYFSDLYVAKLLRVGAAVFIDVGRAWFPANPSDHEFNVLGDVGIGLRLESTRTPNGNLVHIDLAFPLVDGQRVKGLQLLLNVKQSL